MRTSPLFLSGLFFLSVPLQAGLIAIAGLPLATSPVYAACDKDTNVAANCMDELSDAARALFSTDDDAEKAKSVGEATGNCIQCASETLSDQMRQLQPDPE